jgi:hypothetical protein
MPGTKKEKQGNKSFYLYDRWEKESLMKKFISFMT